MASNTIKTGIKVGIAAALAIILYQVSTIFLVYKYFPFDYYITGIAVLCLVAGYFISRYNQPIVVKEAQITKSLLNNLTNKEMVILQLIADGKSNKEIAADNFVEVSTIKTHINNIYAKLEVSNRREAVNYFMDKVVNG